MEKYERSIVHDVAEVAGLPAHSFGDEAVKEGRRVTIWKAENPPCEDELECLRLGQKWDPEEFKARKRAAEEEAKQLALEEAKRPRKDKFVPAKGNYKEKYEHLIDKESALDAARKTEDPNKVYGLGISGEMKKDKRTVEDIQAEIRAKKKQNLMIQQ